MPSPQPARHIALFSWPKPKKEQQVKEIQDNKRITGIRENHNLQRQDEKDCLDNIFMQSGLYLLPTG
jgi:hypothetical protein